MRLPMPAGEAVLEFSDVLQCWPRMCANARNPSITSIGLKDERGVIERFRQTE